MKVSADLNSEDSHKVATRGGKSCGLSRNDLKPVRSMIDGYRRRIRMGGRLFPPIPGWRTWFPAWPPVIRRYWREWRYLRIAVIWLIATQPII